MGGAKECYIKTSGEYCSSVAHCSLHFVESSQIMGFKGRSMKQMLSNIPVFAKTRPRGSSNLSPDSNGSRATLPQTNMEAPRTPLEDLVPFTEAFLGASMLV